MLDCTSLPASIARCRVFFSFGMKVIESKWHPTWCTDAVTGCDETKKGNATKKNKSKHSYWCIKHHMHNAKYAPLGWLISQWGAHSFCLKRRETNKLIAWSRLLRCGEKLESLHAHEARFILSSVVRLNRVIHKKPTMYAENTMDSWRHEFYRVHFQFTVYSSWIPMFCEACG